MHIVLRILIISVLVLVVDGVWLRLQRPMYLKMIRNVQKAEMKLGRLGAIVSYACIIFLIVFVNEVLVTIEDATTAALYGFLIGFAIYGIFNGTNLAIFRRYDKYTGFIDSIWGGFLFALSFGIYNIMT